jgi:hypothetical protein
MNRRTSSGRGGAVVAGAAGSASVVGASAGAVGSGAAVVGAAAVTGGGSGVDAGAAVVGASGGALGCGASDGVTGDSDEAAEGGTASGGITSGVDAGAAAVGVVADVAAPEAATAALRRARRFGAPGTDPAVEDSIGSGGAAWAGSVVGAGVVSATGVDSAGVGRPGGRRLVIADLSLVPRPRPGRRVQGRPGSAEPTPDLHRLAGRHRGQRSSPGPARE